MSTTTTRAMTTAEETDLAVVMAHMKKSEIRWILQRLREGRINGEVAGTKIVPGCLLGGIAALRGVNLHDETSNATDTALNLPHRHDFVDRHKTDQRPVERYFEPIRPGDTPANSERVRRIVDAMVEIIESNSHLWSLL